MIPYDLDPSLHTAEPESAMLGDGISPPPPLVAPPQDPAPQPPLQAQGAPVDPALWAKSPF
jgi:hypothetical protein